MFSGISVAVRILMEHIKAVDWLADFLCDWPR